LYVFLTGKQLHLERYANVLIVKETNRKRTLRKIKNEFHPKGRIGILKIERSSKSHAGRKSNGNYCSSAYYDYLCFLKKKLMRYLLIVAFIPLLLMGCTKTDRDLINGKWSIASVKTNGEFLYTTDKAEQKKALDRIVEKQMEMVAPGAKTPEQEDVLRKVYEQHIAQLGKMTIEIKPDNSFVFNSYNGTRMDATKGTLQFDEEKKELRLKSSVDERFVYALEGNTLTLEAKEGGGSTQLIFKRN
jgi:hypothetical protein